MMRRFCSLCLVGLFGGSTAASGQPVDPWPRGQLFQVQFTEKQSDCGDTYGSAGPAVVQLDRLDAARVLVLPDVQPEKVALRAVFVDRNPGADFAAAHTVTYPSEGLGRIEIQTRLQLDSAAVTDVISGTLAMQVVPFVNPDIPADRQQRADEIRQSACRALLSFSGTRASGQPADLAYVSRVWNLLHRHTQFVTDKNPAGSIPPLEAGMEFPGPHHPEFLWRKSRALFLLGEQLPLTDKDGRLDAFSRGRAAAEQALELDPDSGEALLFFGANLGRYNTTHGVLKMMFGLDDFEDAVLSAIAKKSDYRIFGFATMGDSHNAMGQFYRLVPDSGFVRMLLGVRGDIEKANMHNRASLEYQPDRGDYLKELGVSLLCTGDRNDDPKATAEGIDLLNRAIRSNEWAYDTPEIDRQHMRSLIQNPAHACGYSRDNYEPESDLTGIRAAE